MVVSSISDHVFIRLSRPPSGFLQSMDVEARSGVDGVSVFKTGVRGRPFRVRSIVDVTNRTIALAVYRTYEATQRDQTVPVIVRWADWLFAADRYVILAVEVVSIQQLVIGVGGVASGNALLACDWVLQPWEIS